MDREEVRSLVRTVPPHWRVTLPSSDDGLLRMDAGAFSAVIKHHGPRYSFNIRAAMGDKPTIYGYGVSLRQAFRAAAELMRNLCPASRADRRPAYAEQRRAA